MRVFVWVLAVLVLARAAQPAEVQGRYLRVDVDPGRSGVLRRFGLTASVSNLAGAGGLLQEGFGIFRPETSALRLNTQVSTSEPGLWVYRYETGGLRVERRMETLPNEASLRVTWRVENMSGETRWLTPWVQNDVAPGGRVTVDDRLDLPTLDGVIHPRTPGCFAASRNWAAATDPIERETWYAVFRADQTYAFITRYGSNAAAFDVQTVLMPGRLAPGETWRTTYRISAVRGLRHVDFATDELALQLDYCKGQLMALLAGVRHLPSLELQARILGPEDTVWQLPPEPLTLDPDTPAQCAFAWPAPKPGVYAFRAQVLQGGKVFPLGRDTASPHGEIDAQIVVEPLAEQEGSFTPAATTNPRFPAWTDASRALERVSCLQKRTPAAGGDTAIWFEPALAKVFPEDPVEPAGPPDPMYRMAMGRNEYEGFQLALRPPAGKDLEKTRIHVRALRHERGVSSIPADDIQIFQVLCPPVRVPSYFEGSTGAWPDILIPFTPCTIPGGRTTAFWFSVYARPGLEAGIYTGMIEVHAAGIDPVELWIEVRVFDFDIPTAPALKTDFGFSIETAERAARLIGRNPVAAALARSYLQDALEHRVTLRELTAFPEQDDDYIAALSTYSTALPSLVRQGVSTFSVPASLLETPDLLQAADTVALEGGIAERSFALLADDPPEASWPRLLESIRRWQMLAPHIPVVVYSAGSPPFLPDAPVIVSVNSRLLETPGAIERIHRGGEVWWRVDAEARPPYANFLLDAPAVDHRIVFWQAWARGTRGIQYVGINAVGPDRNPWTDLADTTPANGNGYLVYPGPGGPITSIRWECIRDGIEDYEYLALLAEARERLRASGGDGELVRRAAEAADISALAGSLTAFPRDPGALLNKREAIGGMIEEILRNLR